MFLTTLAVIAQATTPVQNAAPLNQITNLTISFPNWFYGLLACGIIAGIFYIGGLYSKVKGICTHHPKILSALTRISEILLQQKLTRECVFVISESPVKLTAAGITAIAEAKFQEFYEANKNVLLERIKKTNPKTMADLEDVCKNVMLQIEDTLPGFEPIKQYAYQHGQPIQNILFACAIALRDVAAKELSIQDQPPA